MLLINYNPYQGSMYTNTMNQFRGSTFSALSNISQYFGLVEENERLAEQNRLLLNQQHSSFIMYDTLQVDVGDSLQGYSYLHAQVISNSVHKRNNVMMLNKGKKKGVEKEMGVLGPHGIVGIVVQASDNYSLVMPILHKAFLVSARIQKNGQVGSVVWNGQETGMVSMKDVPGHVAVEKGDTVVTSGFSMVFPPGLMIGTIEEIRILPGNSYYELDIKLSTDFNALEWVYVIHNIHKQEQDSLLNRFETVFGE